MALAAVRAVVDDADRVVDLGEPVGELDVDDRPDDLDHLARALSRCCLCHISRVVREECCGDRAAYVADAPDTTSMISRVIAA